MKNRELKLLIETLKDSESKNAAFIQQLKHKLLEYEAQFGSIEGIASRSEFALSTLQMEYKNAQDRILDLESHLRLINCWPANKLSWFTVKWF